MAEDNTPAKAPAKAPASGDRVKVVIAFDRDTSKIGKTREVTVEEARTLVAEGRARVADGSSVELGPTAPTVQPPTPEVISAGTETPPTP